MFSSSQVSPLNLTNASRSRARIHPSSNFPIFARRNSAFLETDDPDDPAEPRAVYFGYDSGANQFVALTDANLESLRGGPSTQVNENQSPGNSSHQYSSTMSLNRSSISSDEPEVRTISIRQPIIAPASTISSGQPIIAPASTISSGQPLIMQGRPIRIRRSNSSQSTRSSVYNTPSSSEVPETDD